jgi:DNA polymerase
MGDPSSTAEGPEDPNDDDPAYELAKIVSELREHLLVQMDSGAVGLPRDPEAAQRVFQQQAALRALNPEREPAAEAAAPPKVPVVETAQTSKNHSASNVPPPPDGADGALSRKPESSQSSNNPQRHDSLHRSESLVQLGGSLDEVRTHVAACERCELCRTRTQTVFSRGTGSSGLCFVGEGPGADEDAQGEPFVGAAGQLLDKMITAMGFARDEVYVCNIVKCRPPNNRKPSAEEMQTCIPYLHRQLELLAPQIIVALGATALEGLLGIDVGITRARGKFRLYQGRIAVMPTFHPAYLLRNPAAKRQVWTDLRQVVHHLGRELPSG